MKLSLARLGFGPLSFVFVAALIFFLPITTAAQSSNNSLPKVGTIKDYPATGLMTGCGNLYFYRAGDPESTADHYVFLSSSDGANAWMNLNGRDVRLKKMRMASPAGSDFRRLFYHHNKVRITVRIRLFKPSGAAADSDPMFKMTIRLQQGRRSRTVHATGSADC